jgi:multiple antibiotic resistance protein
VNAPFHFVTVLMAFFAIMNPVANAPLFVSLTDSLTPPMRRRVAWQSVALAFVIVSVFAVLGRMVLSMFGITLPAFRIAGGILVGLVGYHLLQGRSSSVHTPSEEDNAGSRDAALGLAVSPLAMPILAGPGTIATAMSYSADADAVGVGLVLLAFALICLVTWAAFVGGEWLVRFLGQNAIKVVSRLMGLILAVVGVQMVIEGVRGAAGR